MSDKTIEASADNRVERYRRLALESRKQAEQTEAREIRATFLSLSACWSDLADKAERQSAAERP